MAQEKPKSYTAAKIVAAILAFIVGVQILAEFNPPPDKSRIERAAEAEVIRARREAPAIDRKRTRLNSSHSCAARMPPSACNNNMYVYLRQEVPPAATKATNDIIKL